MRRMGRICSFRWADALFEVRLFAHGANLLLLTFPLAGIFEDSLKLLVEKQDSLKYVEHRDIWEKQC